MLRFLDHTQLDTHTRTFASDQLVAEAAIYTTPMPSAGFEPANAAIERPQAYALDRTATGIGHNKFTG